jgi:hypothetical protein
MSAPSSSHSTTVAAPNLATYLQASQSQGGPARTIDDDFAAIARDVPGFGGLFVGQDGVTRMYLKAGSDRVAAVAAIRSRARQMRLLSRQVEQDIIVVPARFDFAEMKSAYDLIISRVKARPTFADIDDASNVIVIGGATADAVSSLRAEVASLGIPSDMVLIKEVPAVEFDWAPWRGLTKNVRPVVGGVQIAFPVSGGQGLCTLGFNARFGVHLTNSWDPARYFVTNSHCAPPQGITTGLTYGQPTTASPIGTEFLDVPYFTSATNPACPVGSLCRYGDAAVVQYNAGVSSGGPKVAWPRLNTTAFDTVHTYEDEHFPLVGSTIFKIGIATGRTSGQILSQCVMAWRSEDNSYALCQNRASYNRDHGDSGGPVAYREGSRTYFLGIHWGRSSANPSDPNSPLIATYSPFIYLSWDVVPLYRAMTGNSTYVMYPVIFPK